MQRSFILSALIAAALLLPASLSRAAENKPAAAAETSAGGAPKTAEKDAKAAAKIKPVDINSAGKKELMKLKGISDADADKIIAGRPYLTKAHLVTRNVIPSGTYEQIKAQIVAVQKPAAVKK